jgi:hypothetical protein
MSSTTFSHRRSESSSKLQNQDEPAGDSVRHPESSQEQTEPSPPAISFFDSNAEDATIALRPGLPGAVFPTHGGITPPRAWRRRGERGSPTVFMSSSLNAPPPALAGKRALRIGFTNDFVHLRQSSEERCCFHWNVGACSGSVTGCRQLEARCRLEVPRSARVAHTRRHGY